MKLAIVAIPIIIGVIAAIVLFTNTDEVISESIEIDTSTFNQVTNTWPIDSICDVYLAKYVEYNKPDPSQWYLDNFSEERDKLVDDWQKSDSNSIDYSDYYEALKKKTTPELRDYKTTGALSKETAQKDPECYQILLDKYPNPLYE